MTKQLNNNNNNHQLANTSAHSTYYVFIQNSLPTHDLEEKI